jgi:hypothetical protein
MWAATSITTTVLSAEPRQRAIGVYHRVHAAKVKPRAIRRNAFATESLGKYHAMEFASLHSNHTTRQPIFVRP